MRQPAIWQTVRANGFAISGIEDRERPTLRFQFALDGGRLLEGPDSIGAANLLGRLLARGTARRTPSELDDALALLGAEVSVEVRDERILVSGTTLSRTFPATMDLMEEIIFEPRWDTTEFQRAKDAQRVQLLAGRAAPQRIARLLLQQAIHGPDHVLAADPLGTDASLDRLGLADLRALHSRSLAVGGVRLRMVGDVGQQEAERALAGWSERLTGEPFSPPPETPSAARPRLLFYDMPGATQTTLLFGAPGPARAHRDFFPATVMNFGLGGGGFTSRLVREVREARGYTYRIRSQFEGAEASGMFTVSTSVRADATLEAAALIRDILAGYGAGFGQADLDQTRGSLVRSRARAFEASAAKLQLLADIGDFGLPIDQASREAQLLDRLTVADIQALAARYLNAGQMSLVVVGDARTWAHRLEALGMGPPVVLTGPLIR